MSFGLEHVAVRYGPTVALGGVDLRIDPAGITVLVGGDGAGKSTALAALIGLVRPSTGVVRRPDKHQLGYVPATTGMYGDLSVEENLDFAAAAYGLGGETARSRGDELLSMLGLLPFKTRLGDQLSGGMRRKLALAMALMHRPELLVLDEPTTGIDPVSRAEVWELISATALAGTAVLVATTYVNEAARADRVVLLEHGTVLAAGAPDEILARVPGSVGEAGGSAPPAGFLWRRGARWRVWTPSGAPPEGVDDVQPDFEDALVIAELSADAAVEGGRPVPPGPAPEDVAGGAPRGSPAVLAEAVDLSRSFGSFTAVRSVAVEITGGEVVGLLGANGAGKTTLIRLLLGLLRPSGGTARLFGAAPSRDGRRRVGYVPQSLGLYDDLTVAENWRFTQTAFGVRSRLPEGLQQWRDDLVRALPFGVQRLVAFALARSHRPELMVLDEPTSGVAPLGRACLWAQVREVAEAGTGVLITTHNIEEAEQCDRLVVMAAGEVLAAGSPAELVAGREVVEVTSSDRRRTLARLEQAGYRAQLHGRRLRLAAPLDAVAALLGGGEVATATAVPATLEEAFVELARSSARGP